MLNMGGFHFIHITAGHVIAAGISCMALTSAAFWKERWTHKLTRGAICIPHCMRRAGALG